MSRRRIAVGPREPRDRWVSLRVTSGELARLRRTARSQGEPMAELIRREGIEAVPQAIGRPKSKTGDRRRRKRRRVKT